MLGLFKDRIEQEFIRIIRKEAQENGIENPFSVSFNIKMVKSPDGTPKIEATPYHSGQYHTPKTIAQLLQ